MRQVIIRDDYITLGQLLKLTDCISSGGEVKFFLQEMDVQLNGEKENRRGKKIYPDDVVEIEGHGRFQVVRK